MASIETNQRRAYLAHAQDAAFVLAERLKNLSPAQRAAIIASVAHQSATPIDITLVTGEKSDALDAAVILDGDVPEGEDGGWNWQLGSGCEFRVEVLP